MPIPRTLVFLLGLLGCGEDPEAEWRRQAEEKAEKFPSVARYLEELDETKVTLDTLTRTTPVPPIGYATQTRDSTTPLTTRRLEDMREARLERSISTLTSLIDFAIETPDSTYAVWMRLDDARLTESTLIAEVSGWEEILGRWEGRDDHIKAKIDSLDLLLASIEGTIDSIEDELITSHGASENLKSSEPYPKRGEVYRWDHESLRERNLFVSTQFRRELLAIDERFVQHGARLREADSLLALAGMAHGYDQIPIGIEAYHDHAYAYAFELSRERDEVADSVEHWGGTPKELDARGVYTWARSVREELFYRPVLLIEERSTRNRGATYWSIDGTVHNISLETISFSQVLVRFYDRRNNYIGMKRAYLADSSLGPDERTTFDIFADVEGLSTLTLTFLTNEEPILTIDRKLELPRK